MSCNMRNLPLYTLLVVLAVLFVAVRAQTQQVSPVVSTLQCQDPVRVNLTITCNITLRAADGSLIASPGEHIDRITAVAVAAAGVSVTSNTDGTIKYTIASNATQMAISFAYASSSSISSTFAWVNNNVVESFNVIAYYNGAPIGSNATLVRRTPGAIAPSMMLVSFTPAPPRARINNTIIISTRDQWGNPLENSATIRAGLSVALDFAINASYTIRDYPTSSIVDAPEGQGKYALTFFPAQKGTALVYLRYKGILAKPVVGQPVRAGPVYANNTILDCFHYVSGQYNVYCEIQARDFNNEPTWGLPVGNDTTSSAPLFHVEVLPAYRQTAKATAVTPTGSYTDGRFAFQFGYTPDAWSDTTVEVDFDGEEIQGSPFVLPRTGSDGLDSLSFEPTFDNNNGGGGGGNGGNGGGGGGDEGTTGGGQPTYDDTTTEAEETTPRLGNGLDSFVRFEDYDEATSGANIITATGAAVCLLIAILHTAVGFSCIISNY